MEDSRLTHSREETLLYGRELGEKLVPGTLLTLAGELGAGKTTLVQGLLEALGATRPYVSPTFVIMKLYDLEHPSGKGIKRIYHADAYRVGEKDFTTLGFEEWLADPEGLVLLEWPERIEGILPEKRIRLTLSALSPTERKISLVTSDGNQA